MVVGVAAEGLSHGLGFEGGGEIALEALVQGLLDPAQRLRWQPRDYRLFYADYTRCKATVGLSEVLPEVEAARVAITLL